MSCSTHTHLGKPANEADEEGCQKGPHHHEGQIYWQLCFVDLQLSKTLSPRRLWRAQKILLAN